MDGSNKPKYRKSVYKRSTPSNKDSVRKRASKFARDAAANGGKYEATVADLRENFPQLSKNRRENIARIAHRFHS